jgi:hypothetical protein
MSEEQRGMLETKFPHSAYIRSGAFQRQEEKLGTEARDASAGSVSQADHWNEFAWTLVTNGAELAKADKCAERAIEILNAIDPALALLTRRSGLPTTRTRLDTFCSRWRSTVLRRIP